MFLKMHSEFLGENMFLGPESSAAFFVGYFTTESGTFSCGSSLFSTQNSMRASHYISVNAILQKSCKIRAQEYNRHECVIGILNNNLLTY